jgi:hypothetical protein
MKNRGFYRLLSLSLFVAIFMLSNVVTAQSDTTQTAPSDTVKTEKAKPPKKDKKKRDSFKVFAGVTLNNLNVSDDVYQSELMAGYDLGASYKRGRFFYWEIGARYNNFTYKLKPVGDSIPGDNFSVKAIDIPITGGINFLSFISRIAGLRVFISAVPTIHLGVGNNDLGLTKDDINSFCVRAQGGIGVDVAFIFLETGFNYGFGDMLKSTKSNPSQIFINLGFRF